MLPYDIFSDWMAAVTNYEQALLYLEATVATSDDFIISMYTLKVNLIELISYHMIALTFPFFIISIGTNVQLLTDLTVLSG